jgi:hypothetical protein
LAEFSGSTSYSMNGTPSWMVRKLFSQLVCRSLVLHALLSGLILLFVGCEKATSTTTPENSTESSTAQQALTPAPTKNPGETSAPRLPDSAITPSDPTADKESDLTGLTNGAQQPPAATPANATTPKLPRKTSWVTKSELPRDLWDVMYLGNSKIGSMHTEANPIEGGAGDQLKLTLDSLLRVNRAGQSTTQRISVISRETYEGELLDFIATIYESDSKTEVTGNRLLDDLVIQATQANGQTSRANIPWKRGYRGPFALEQELRQQPIVAGESREISYLSIPLFRLAKLQIKGSGKQKVAMLDGTAQELQEVSITIYLDNKPVMETIAWVDENGETLKSAALGLQVVTYRASRSLAEGVDSAAQADLLKVTSVPLPAGTPNLHLAKSLTYNIKCSKDPLKLFPNRTNQTVRSAVALECDVTVYSVTPGSPLPESLAKQDPPTDAERDPSPMIQSADPLIVELAHQCAPEETDPWKLAVALERFVHDKIERKDFSRSFATAAEVAKTPRGDCTEHGVLLAALLRARNIPARIASGLVYVDTPQGPSMGYHLWNEAYVGDRWIPLDAVLGNGGIGPGHIKVLDSALSDQNPYITLLPVLQVLGDLKITSVTAAGN